MRKVIKLDVNDVTPSIKEVMENQGMAGRKNLPERIRTLMDSARDLFRQLAEPMGVFEEISPSDFWEIYEGNGMNSDDGPVPNIVSGADSLAIFAATMGQTLAMRSSELFKEGKAPLGYMLDAVNSCGAERLGMLMGLRFLECLPEELRRSKNLKVQYYCPGHCGWHISGQTRLFQALRPKEIGISVNSSWAMQPLKSISGILAAGEIEVHRFQPVFSFCKLCKEKKCVQRLKILEQSS